MKACLIVLPIVGFVAMPLGAQTRVDPLASSAIRSGDLTAAERRLVAERRIYRDRPEILLNLAAIYARTHRENDARTLYQNVLSDRAVLMDVSEDRTSSSHAIARAGLARLSAAPRGLASR